MPVQENQIQDLRNIGYYHGYKGYRFIRKSNNPIEFTAFSQIVSLNNFDMQLKGLLYPSLMFIENALKSYVLEATLAECQSEKLNDVYKLALTYYKENFQYGSNNYKKEFKKRMDLEMKINSSLSRDYMLGKDFVNHFYNQDRDIPIWAAFESLTLGEFGNFYSCANKKIREDVSKQLTLPKNFDDDGFLLADIIFALKDLR
ncbi:MAG: Abi family protein, partial [Treponema sp.]|nr:Abi family protein [Treponema sp.]